MKTPERPRPLRIPALAPRWLATVGGLGYLPLMPGTFGSLAGVALYTAAVALASHWRALPANAPGSAFAALWLTIPLTVIVAVVGVWVSGYDAREMGMKDPQFIVVDEVSGQLITFVVACAPLNWKYSLAGFILFRVFDIWKPFPVRQAESFRGGWGIMADDWLAGLFAGLGLCLLRVLKF